MHVRLFPHHRLKSRKYTINSFIVVLSNKNTIFTNSQVCSSVYICHLQLSEIIDLLVWLNLYKVALLRPISSYITYFTNYNHV